MTDNLSASLEARDLRYAARLAEMIRCRTVSKKDGFEPSEFLKLRQVIAELFSLTTPTCTSWRVRTPPGMLW